MARNSEDFGQAVKKTFRTPCRCTSPRNANRVTSIAPARIPFGDAASCQTYRTFPRGEPTSTESKYATGPNLACSATMHEVGFVCFSSHRTYGGGIVKFACFDAKPRINRKSDTLSARTRIHLVACIFRSTRASTLLLTVEMDWPRVKVASR